MVTTITKYGVTENGFKAKNYETVIASLHDNAKRMFGSDVDLTPGSPIKIYIDMMAAELVDLWNELGATYDSGFLDTATGFSLDNLGKLVGAERSNGIYATGEVTFFRTTAMPPGSPRIIPAGTKISTATIRPVEFVTTGSVYFEPQINGEQHTTTAPTYEIKTKNIIHSIQGLYDANGNVYTVSDTGEPKTVTFSGRNISFSEQIPEDTLFYVNYKPLSVTAPVVSTEVGSDSNVAANTITVMDTPVDFVHYISNEKGVDSGSDVESDSHFRNTVIGATQAIGKATKNALEYYIGKVSNVKNVLVEDPLKQDCIDSISGNGIAIITLSKHPIYEIRSIVGSVGGVYNIESYDAQTGEVNLSAATRNGETVTAIYTVVVPGKIKIYVEGGEVGDEWTPDTIVYAIEHTRAAGIQAVGYDTEDPAACGSETAKFSWFYRPNSSTIDMNIIVYFDDESELTDAAKNIVLTQAQDAVADHINELELTERLYKNKILQLVISSNDDIVDAQLMSWKINDETKAVTDTYIEAGQMEIMIANDIVLTKAVE